ncbi:MAG: glycosyltransferase family 2 protein [candidate division WOR-3 bacterium]
MACLEIENSNHFEKVMISVIVVTYNSEKFIRSCLKSVISSFKKREFEIIVVDNCSSDSTARIVYDEFKNVRLIRLKKNKGFAYANNLAMERSNGDFLCLLNPDTIVTENALERMADFLERNDDVGMVGAKLKNFDGSLQLSCRRFPNYLNVFFGRKSLLRNIFPNNPISKDFMLEYLDYDKIQDVDWMMGAAVMLKKDLVEKIGFFDENFKLFVEDTDLCYRIKKSGKRVVFLPDAIVFHFHGASVKEGFSRAQVYHNLGMFNFFRKHFIKTGIFKFILYCGIIIRLYFVFLFSLFERLLTNVKGKTNLN